MVRFISLYSQEGKSIADSNLVKQDTLVSDTLSRTIKKISPNAIDKQVKYTAKGLKKNDLVNRRAILTEEAKVNYGDLEITADSIVFDLAKNTVFATGRKDTTESNRKTCFQTGIPGNRIRFFAL
jgi:glucose dehydrogenase